MDFLRIESCLPVFAHVEVAVGEPETVLDLDVDVPLAFQKRNRSNPVPLLDVVLQGGHFLLLDLVVGPILSVGALHLRLRDRGSRTIHLI
jgi:hypothetical protein